MTKIINNFLIIGFGNIACRHLKNILSLKMNLTVTVLTRSGKINEINDDRVTIISDKNQLGNYQIDYVLICSPATYHIEHLEFAIGIGCEKIFVEKPLVTDWQISEFRKKFNDDEKRRIFIGYCLRYNKSLVALRDAVEGQICGEFISIRATCGQYLPSWRPNKDYRTTVSAQKVLGGGALLELSHEIDYLNWIFKGISVHSSSVLNSGYLDIDVEDVVDMLGKTYVGASVNLHLNFFAKQAQRNCTIVGESGSLFWDFGQSTVTFSDGVDQKCLYRGTENDRDQMYIDMLDDFLAVDAHKITCAASVASSLEVLKIIKKTREVAN
jgi:predicted dehydrogenase